MQHVVDEALHLYSRYGTDDVAALAGRLGIGVYDLLDADHLTEVYFPDLRAIVIRPGLPDFQRRYLLAHALGHHVLHREGAARDYLRVHLLAREAPDGSRDPRITRAEHEADLFASYLLIPETRLQPLLARPWARRCQTSCSCSRSSCSSRRNRCVSGSPMSAAGRRAISDSCLSTLTDRAVTVEHERMSTYR